MYNNTDCGLDTSHSRFVDLNSSPVSDAARYCTPHFDYSLRRQTFCHGIKRMSSFQVRILIFALHQIQIIRRPYHWLMNCDSSLSASQESESVKNNAFRLCYLIMGMLNPSIRLGDKEDFPLMVICWPRHLLSCNTLIWTHNISQILPSYISSGSPDHSSRCVRVCVCYLLMYMQC